MPSSPDATARHRQRGFSLLEVMFASTILSIFILGIGGGATRVGGIFFNAPGFTPFENLPVMGGFNVATAPVANTIVVHFPAAGTYPYELDYSECCGGLLALAMTVGQSNFRGVPPTGSLTISPNNPPTLPAGQTQGRRFQTVFHFRPQRRIGQSFFHALVHICLA